MGKVINAMIWGNKRTKAYLWSMILIAVFAVACLFLALQHLSILYGIEAFLLSGLDFIIFRSVSFEETVMKVDKEQLMERRKLEQQKKIVEKMEKEAQELKEVKGTGTILKDFTVKKRKKLFFKYKVKKVHKAILIDYSLKYKIQECPAFTWLDKKYCHFLLLEEEPRKVSLPLMELQSIGYEKAVVARPDAEYMPLKEKPNSLLSRVFVPYLPNYYDATKEGRISKRKNLYILGEDIHITNTSAKEFMELHPLPFWMEDEFSRSHHYGDYFLEGHRLGVLWKDGVISMAEYKNRIKLLLKGMAEADLNRETFMESMEQLIEKRLITQEYAEYYIEYRRKYQALKKGPVRKKKG